jgi:hypothetical protein
MIHDVPKPQISPEFTIDDIHAIREWTYERLKDATTEEWIEDINRRSSIAQKHINACMQTRNR